jgi:TonB family protein
VRGHPQHVHTPPYPADALMQGIQGQVYVEHSVWPDGRSRNPRVIFALPKNMFDSAARDSLLHTEFTPGSPGSKPAQCTMFFRFVVSGQTKEDYPRLERFVHETLTKAQAGDPGTQMLYGMLLAGLPQLNKPRSQPTLVRDPVGILGALGEAHVRQVVCSTENRANAMSPSL